LGGLVGLEKWYVELICFIIALQKSTKINYNVGGCFFGNWLFFLITWYVNSPHKWTYCGKINDSLIKYVMTYMYIIYNVLCVKIIWHNCIVFWGYKRECSSKSSWKIMTHTLWKYTHKSSNTSERGVRRADEWMVTDIYFEQYKVGIHLGTKVESTCKVLVP